MDNRSCSRRIGTGCRKSTGWTRTDRTRRGLRLIRRIRSVSSGRSNRVHLMIMKRLSIVLLGLLLAGCGSHLTARPPMAQCTPKHYYGDLAWSPDGTAILFTRAWGAVDSQVVSVDIDSRRIKPLTGADARSLAGAWSPDG